jgi:SynChlorMet cassette radical SAM/SPASM protein ScmF
MNDNENYPLNQLYFYLTNECNLACRHCWISPEYRKQATATSALPLEVFSSIIRQALPLGLQSVKMTGGEPLLHPEIREMIVYCGNDRLQVILETNGTLITPEFAETIASCGNACISVSLDGGDPATHEWMRGVEGCFAQACRGIRLLTDAGIRPQIIMSLVKRNHDQMEDVVRLAESLGAGSVKFNIVQPSGRAESMYGKGETLGIEEIIRIGKWCEEELKDSASIPLYFDIPLAFRPMSGMFNKNGDGCSICAIKGILGILADGHCALCGIGENIPELVFGDLAVDTLEGIWRSSPCLQEIRRNLPHNLKGICGDCVMKHICLGSCIAQNYYRNRDLWAPYWFCEEADRLGLFPESRKLSSYHK